MSSAMRARFRELHSGSELFVMPNVWDLGSARLVESAGVSAIATTSAGFAWSQGRSDYSVTRNEVVGHVAALAATVNVPINVDSEQLWEHEPGGIVESVRQLHDAGAAGCSVEDWDPTTGKIEPFEIAERRVRQAAEAAHKGPDPLVLTARCELLDIGVLDLGETIRRLVAYREAGADCLYAPGLRSPDDIRAVIEAVDAPVSVLAFEDTPAVQDLAALGVRRVSTGSRLASTAYRSALDGLAELHGPGTSTYARTALTTEHRDAFDGPRLW